MHISATWFQFKCKQFIIDVVVIIIIVVVVVVVVTVVSQNNSRPGAS